MNIPRMGKHVSNPGCLNCDVYSNPVSLDMSRSLLLVNSEVSISCIEQSKPLTVVSLVRNCAYGHFQQVFSPQGVESPDLLM
jgi:hypothetical protein